MHALHVTLAHTSIPIRNINKFVVQRLGYYLPFSVAGAVLTAIGSGLISTYTPHTSTGQWIGYQVILGAGRGFIMQMVCNFSSPIHTLVPSGDVHA